MKKILVVLALSLFVTGAFAQKGKVYVGTSVMSPVSALNPEDRFDNFQTGFNYTKKGDAKTITFGLAPEVGYFVSDNWAIGLGVAFNYKSFKENSDADNINTTGWGVNPYARYYACKADKFSFYLQGGFHYASNKVKDQDAKNQWGINIVPGVAYNLSEKFAINATFGKVGYNDYDNDHTSFGIDLNMSTLLFGLTYTF